jgi:hypothetical protein
MRKDSGAHPRIPEFAQMFGNMTRRRLAGLHGEEAADLIGHLHEPVGR